MIKAANLQGRLLAFLKQQRPMLSLILLLLTFGIDHGHAVAITFNEFLEFNYLNKNLSTSNFDIDKRFNILFKLTETQNIFELKNFFLNLEKNAKIKVDFNSLGINIQKNINLIMKNVNIQRLSNNPITLDYNLLKVLLKKTNWCNLFNY